MIPVNCRIKHDPERGTFGDCLRACVASIMEKNAEQVPHFFEDNPAPQEGNARLRGYLRQHGFHAFFVTIDGATSFPDLLKGLDECGGDTHCIVYGMINDGTHVVIASGGKIVHDPAWFRQAFTGPCVVDGQRLWQVLVICR